MVKPFSMSEHDNFSASWDKPVFDLSLIVTCKSCTEGRRDHSPCQLHYRELVAAVKARETSKALSGSYYERFQIQETEE